MSDQPDAETSITTSTTNIHALESVGSRTQLSLRCNFSDYILRNNYMFRPIKLHLSDSCVRLPTLPRVLIRTTGMTQFLNIHAPGVIRTRNPMKRVAAGPPLRPRGQWGSAHLQIKKNFLLKNISIFYLATSFMVLQCKIKMDHKRIGRAYCSP